MPPGELKPCALEGPHAPHAARGAPQEPPASHAPNASDGRGASRATAIVVLAVLAAGGISALLPSGGLGVELGAGRGVEPSGQPRAEPSAPARGAAVAGAITPDAEASIEPRMPFQPVDVNHASPDELELLPGIGVSVADRITRDRDSNGPFSSAADLDRVKGIGPATVAKLRPHISCTTLAPR